MGMVEAVIFVGRTVEDVDSLWFLFAHPQAARIARPMHILIAFMTSFL
jgi:hypothetical protein